jgi:hypothetical protein
VNACNSSRSGQGSFRNTGPGESQTAWLLSMSFPAVVVCCEVEPERLHCRARADPGNAVDLVRVPDLGNHPFGAVLAHSRAV